MGSTDKGVQINVENLSTEQPVGSSVKYLNERDEGIVKLLGFAYYISSKFLLPHAMDES